MFIARLQVSTTGQSTPVNVIASTSSQPTTEPQRASSSFWNNWGALAGGVPQDTLNQQQQQPFVDLGATQRWSQDGGWGLQSLLTGSQPGRGFNPDPNQARNSDRSRSLLRPEANGIQAFQPLKPHSERNFYNPQKTPTLYYTIEHPALPAPFTFSYDDDDDYDDDSARYKFEFGHSDDEQDPFTNEQINGQMSDRLDQVSFNDDNGEEADHNHENQDKLYDTHQENDGDDAEDVGDDGHYFIGHVVDESSPQQENDREDADAWDIGYDGYYHNEGDAGRYDDGQENDDDEGGGSDQHDEVNNNSDHDDHDQGGYSDGGGQSDGYGDDGDYNDISDGGYSDGGDSYGSFGGNDSD